MDPLNAASAANGGGFDCEFVKKPKELQSECSVCLLVLREPYHTSCCGYSFCEKCIKQIQASTICSECPLCKKNFQTYPNKWLKRELCQLDVYCAHRKDGCDWTGPLGRLDDHLKCSSNTDSLGSLTEGCGFVLLVCRACNESVPRNGYGVHVRELCEQRPFSCDHCGEYSSRYMDVVNNHWPRCPYYPVECVNKCGAHPKRKDLHQHISDECHLTSIPCELCYEKVLRGEMREHLVSNLTTHISLMIDDKLDAVHEQAQEAEERMHELRQENQYLQDDVEKLRLQVGKNKEEIHRLSEENTETQTLYSEMSQQNEELTENCGNLQEKLEVVSEDYEHLHDGYDDLKQENDRLQEDYECLRDSYDCLKQENDRLQAEVKRLSEDIKLMKRRGNSSVSSHGDNDCQQAGAMKQSSDRNLEDRFDEIYVSSDSESSQRSGEKYKDNVMYSRPLSTRQDEKLPVPPNVLKMQNYSRYKSGSLGGYWDSKPFCSDSPPSYKLCLSVEASRSGNLSVYVCMMHGEFDDQLDWPFNATVTVQLINHGGGKHWEKRIPLEDGQRVTKRNRVRETRGESKFMTLYENSSFIENDTLWFKVLSVRHLSHKERTWWR